MPGFSNKSDTPQALVTTPGPACSRNGRVIKREPLIVRESLQKEYWGGGGRKLAVFLLPFSLHRGMLAANVTEQQHGADG
jgi:hypothetical protein